MLFLIILLQSFLLIMFGAATASFIQLIIYRKPRGLSINHPRSFCEECRAPIKFPYLLPLLGFIFAKGKCKACGYKIPVKYFFTELLSGIAFAILVWILILLII